MVWAMPSARRCQFSEPDGRLRAAGLFRFPVIDSGLVKDDLAAGRFEGEGNVNLVPERLDDRAAFAGRDEEEQKTPAACSGQLAPQSARRPAPV